MLSFLRSLIKTILLADLIMFFPSAALLSETLERFWENYGLLLIVTHVVFILVFIIVRGRIDWINQHPPAQFDREKGEQKSQNAERWLRIMNLIFVGILLVSSGATLYVVGYHHPLPIAYEIAVPAEFFVLCLLLTASSASTLLLDYLLYLRKRLAKSMDEVLVRGQAPILYLRSFKDDHLTGERDNGDLTEEEELAKALERIGPLIALGEPREALPQAGAVRAYFSKENDRDWKNAVLNYIGISRLVVLRAGLSPSLKWEIQNSIQRLHPSQLILLIPFKKKDYDQFRRRVQHLFLKRLPDHPGHTTNRLSTRIAEKEKVGSLLGLIYFDADWTAHFEKITMDGIGILSLDKSSSNDAIYIMLHYALRPVYARLGLTWDVPEDSFANLLIGKKRSKTIRRIIAEKPEEPKIQDDGSLIGCGLLAYPFLFLSIAFVIGYAFGFRADANSIYNDSNLLAFQKIAQIAGGITAPIGMLAAAIFFVCMCYLGSEFKDMPIGCGWIAYCFLLANIAYLVIYSFLLKTTELQESDQVAVILISSIFCLGFSVGSVWLYHLGRRRKNIHLKMDSAKSIQRF